MMYKVISAVIYTIIDDCICIDYRDFLQENLSRHNINFGNIKFNNLSGLGINEILMNIMSYHSLAKSTTLRVIFACLTALVPYYISKGSIIIETEVSGVDDIPRNVKKSNLIIYIKRTVV